MGTPFILFVSGPKTNGGVRQGNSTSWGGLCYLMHERTFCCLIFTPKMELHIVVVVVSFLFWKTMNMNLFTSIDASLVSRERMYNVWWWCYMVSCCSLLWCGDKWKVDWNQLWCMFLISYLLYNELIGTNLSTYLQPLYTSK